MTGVWFPVGAKKNFFLFATDSRTDMEPTQPPTQCVLRRFTLGLEADHSSIIVLKLRLRGALSPTPIRLMAWCLIKHWIHLHGMVLSQIYLNITQLLQVNTGMEWVKNCEIYVSWMSWHFCVRRDNSISKAIGSIYRKRQELFPSPEWLWGPLGI
jgi:hypothetical protein